VKNHKNYITIISELEKNIKDNSKSYKKEKDYFYTSINETDIHSELNLSHHISYITAK